MTGAGLKAQICPLKTLRVVTSPQRHIAKRLRKSAWERPGLADQTSGLQVKILLFIKLVNNDNVNHQKLSKPFPSATDTVQDHILNAV